MMSVLPYIYLIPGPVIFRVLAFYNLRATVSAEQALFIYCV